MSDVRKFSEFDDDLFNGPKLKMDEVLDKEIKVLDFAVSETKIKSAKSTFCLTIAFELGGEKHILFTGSMRLKLQLERFKEKLPFIATIKKIGEGFRLT